MQVCNWPVGPNGLLYDRCWMVVNRNGVCLSQKREPSLCLVQPQVHLSSNKLLLRASGQIMFQQLNKKHTVPFLFKNIYCFIAPFAPQEWTPFQFLLKTPVTCTHAIKGVKAKSVVTGALTSTEKFYGQH